MVSVYQLHQLVESPHCTGEKYVRTPDDCAPVSAGSVGVPVDRPWQRRSWALARTGRTFAGPIESTPRAWPVQPYGEREAAGGSRGNIDPCGNFARGIGKPPSVHEFMQAVHHSMTRIVH
jgi:hypothetical protein